jgi:hypothetical protein
MAYKSIYRMHGQKDILGNDWYFDLKEDLRRTDPTPQDVIMGADPVILNTIVHRQDIFEPLKLFSHEITLQTDGSEGYEEIRDSNDYDRFLISSDGENGIVDTYLDPLDFSQPYKQDPINITHEGYEGFHILKNIPITDQGGEYFDGYVSIIKVFAAALLKLKKDSYSIYTVCNLYESNHVTDESPLAQTYIDSRTLWEDNEPISCLDAVIRLLEPFLIQVNYYDGNWWLIRVPEMKGTDIRTLVYDSNGDYVSLTTTNLRLSMTGNGVSRENRKDWINNNASLYIKPPSREISVKLNTKLRYSIFENYYFTDFNTIDFGGYVSDIPEGWSKVGGSTTRRIYKFDDPYTVNGKVNYPIVIENGTRIQSDPVAIFNDERAAYRPIKIKVITKYRFDLDDDEVEEGVDKTDYKISMIEYITGNPEAANIANRFQYTDGIMRNNIAIKQPIFTEYITASDDYGEKVIEFIVGPLSGIEELEYSVQPYFFLEDGSSYEHSNTAMKLVVHSVRFEAEYYNDESGEFETYPDNLALTEYNRNARGEDYEKEIYYGDNTEDNFTSKKWAGDVMVENFFYRKSGSEYIKTNNWDYNSLDINATIQEVMMHDLLYQYSTPTHILSGELMGSGFKMIDVYQDSKDENRLFLPLNTAYSLKSCIMSCELMELKSDASDIQDYLADEEKEYTLDQNGDPIIVKF